MAALLTTLLSLALCSAPAVAYRNGLSLDLHNHLGVEAARAALHRRAGASVNGSVGDASVGAGELDSALERKGGNTRCVCLRTLAEKERVWNYTKVSMELFNHTAGGVTTFNSDKDPVVFAMWDNLGEKSPCSEVCPNLCNRRLWNVFGFWKAKDVHMEPTPSVRVWQCVKESCKCLDTDFAASNVDYYLWKRWGRLKISDIVDQKEYYDSNAQCHESCSCEGWYSPLCADPWSWSTFLEADGFRDDVVGLTSTQLVEQFFTLIRGGESFTANLDSLQQVNEIRTYYINETALSFSAEGESNTTYNVQIGLGGGETSKTWELKRRGASSFSGKDLGWSLKEKNGQETFSIKKTEQGEEWKVKQIAGSNKGVKFWVSLDSSGIFRFHTDRELNSQATGLQGGH